MTQLRKEKRDIFRGFFGRFVYGLVYRPHKLQNLLNQIKDEDAKQIFRNYVKYAARFQVRLHHMKGSFSVVPVAPYKTKFHVRINRGLLEAASEAIRNELEPVYEDLYAEDGLAIPERLEDFLKQKHAKVVQVDDYKGRSVLNQLESISYRDDALTFVLHNTGHQKYIFRLVGENVRTDTTWRDAGKVITALQKEFYGRTKSGRPRFKNVAQRTYPHEELGAQKENTCEVVLGQSHEHNAAQIASPDVQPTAKVSNSQRATGSQTIGVAGKES